MQILVVTPIEDEFEALLSALCDLYHTNEKVPIGRTSARVFSPVGLTVAQGGLGKAQFGIQLQHLIDHVGAVDLAVCAGTAGGLHPGLSIGDVVVATETVEHDFKWGMADRPPPRFEGNQTALSKLQTELTGRSVPLTVHFGPVASGDEGIADSNRARELHEQTGALAVAWEGAGGARAAQFSGVPFLEIRAISDGAGESASDEFKQNIPTAMRNIAAVIRHVVECLSDLKQTRLSTGVDE